MSSSQSRLRATLAALMQVTGESQDDLARALRITQATFSRKQGKRTKWTLDDCDKIALHYGISICDLLGGTDAALNALERNRSGPEGCYRPAS